MKIGELAEATGVSVRAIRHYDQCGLLQSQRSDNGYRAFGHIAVTQVRQIQSLISTGFSLEEIASFPECMTLLDGAKACPDILAAQRKRMRQLDDQIADLQLRRERLRDLLS